MSEPADRRYTAEHEWVLLDGQVARIGITAFAQEALGDIVYVSLPEPGTQVQAGGTLGEVESTKSVSDVFAPVSGTVRARNEALVETPELVNSDPYGQGWIAEVVLSQPEQVAGLLDADGYARVLAEQ